MAQNLLTVIDSMDKFYTSSFGEWIKMEEENFFGEAKFVKPVEGKMVESAANE